MTGWNRSPVRRPQAARYLGLESEPDPLNLAVGVKMTGRECHIKIALGPSEEALVESGFAPGHSFVLTPVSETFYGEMCLK